MVIYEKSELDEALGSGDETFLLATWRLCSNDGDDDVATDDTEDVLDSEDESFLLATRRWCSNDDGDVATDDSEDVLDFLCCLLLLVCSTLDDDGSNDGVSIGNWDEAFEEDDELDNLRTSRRPRLIGGDPDVASDDDEHVMDFLCRLGCPDGSSSSKLKKS